MEQVVGSKKKTGHKWVKGDRKPRKDGMIQALQDLVFKWWLEETQMSPRKCDVVRKCTNHKQWETHANHFYQES
jgi:hypothetical protein